MTLGWLTANCFETEGDCNTMGGLSLLKLQYPITHLNWQISKGLAMVVPQKYYRGVVRILLPGGLGHFSSDSRSSTEFSP